MAFKTSEKYKSVIYSGDCRHKLKLLFNGVELADADVYCESLKVTSRILPNGSTRFSLDNFIAKEAEIILHDIDTTIIQSPVNISIGTLVDGTYEYVPIGLFVVQDLPTTDKNKTTIKLRDYAVKFDFGYNAKDIIDENGGSATLLQVLQDICSKAGVETDITKFYGSNSKIGIYDNTITGRAYISYLAEQAGCIATIDRSGKLIFVQLKDLETVEIPLNIVEKYEDGEKYEISRVVYEDAIRKFEYGDESKDTLFINTANPYIDNEVLKNTLTGTEIETSDSSDNEVTNYKQYGYTKQNVYSGKNKFNVEDITTNATQIISKDTSGFIITDHWAEALVSDEKLKELLEPSTVYTASAKVTLISKPDASELTGGNHGNIMILYKANETSKGLLATTLDIKNNWNVGETKELTADFSTPSDLTGWKILTYTYLTSKYGKGSFQIDYMMIRKKGEDDTFEPYVGGKTSPSPDYPQEIEVGRGKNLFNKDLYTYDYVTENDTGNMIENYYKDIPIYVGKPNTSYFVSTNFINGYTPYGKSLLYVLIADYAYGNGYWVAIGHTGALPTNKEYYNKTITSDDKGYLHLRVYKTLSKAVYEELMANVEVQIEEGPVATNYLPYNTIESKTKTRNLYPSSSDIPTGYYAVGTKDTENTHNGDTSIRTSSAWAGPWISLKEVIPNNNLKVGDKVAYSIYFKTNFIPTKTMSFTMYRFTSASGNKTVYVPVSEVKPGEWIRLSFEFEINEYSLTSERARIEADYYDKDDPYYFGNNRENYIWFASPQFEVGELTDYQVSNESSITYDLGDNFLADKDYIENGVLNKNIGKVVLDGSENWSTYNNKFYTLPKTAFENANLPAYTTNLMCNYFKMVNHSTTLTSIGTIYSGTNNLNFNFDDGVGGVDNFKTWLSNNNVEVYYELATTEQIPLETTGELRTFEPYTIITNDLDSNMEIEYKMNRTQVSQILELNKDIPLNSFKTGKIIGNPAIDAYDIIKIIDGDKEFKTFATNDLTYNGVMINTFDTQIGKEAKKENVTLTPEATFKKWAKTEIDNVEAEVRINTGKIETVVDEMGNMYTKGQVNELIANAETGVTNTFSEAGGNNVFRNTGLWFVNSGEDAETKPYEFWEGKANEGNNHKATNYRSILLGKGSFIQDVTEVPNGNYSISFYYRKLISNAVASVVINDKEYELNSTSVKQFYTGEQNIETGEYIVDPVVVSNNHIKIEFKCDALDGVEVYDLMCNKGSVKLAYSQNQNETTTDTVNISRGITITSSKDENTKFKADYDGIRILDGTNTPKTTFTDKGTETDELVVRKKATITGLLHQEVDDQTWATKI